MFSYPESMVDNSTNYNNMEKMEEGITNPMYNEENERSTSVTIPTGLSERLTEMNDSPKFVFKKTEEKRICQRMTECMFRHILFVMVTFILVGTGLTCLIMWLLNPDIKFD